MSVNEQIFVTVNDDGSADMTLTIADDDHRFSVSAADDASYAIVSYEETLSWRGQTRVSEPDEAVWRQLMQSDTMTEYLESQDLTGVRRER